MTHGHTTPQPPSSAPSHPSKVSSFKDHQHHHPRPCLKSLSPGTPGTRVFPETLWSSKWQGAFSDTGVWDCGMILQLFKQNWVNRGGGWFAILAGVGELPWWAGTSEEKVHPRHIIHFVLIKCLTKISQSLQLIQLVGDPLTETCVQYN